jgi:hypothetical protein
VYQPVWHVGLPASIHRRNQDFAAPDPPCASRCLIQPKKVTPCVEPRIHPRFGLFDADVARAARCEFNKLLVAGRCDRGGLMVSRAGIDRFCKQRGFDAYLETSALTGWGCDELRDAIVRQIPWDKIPWTASPQIFKLLRDECVGLRNSGHVLLRTSELKQQIEMQLPGKKFSMEELRAVVRLLAGPGIISRLEFGDFVLLVPERINAYAAAVIRSVRSHADEIGCISEDRLLAGDLDYQDMKRLPRDEEDIVLRAMHQTFIDHGLCLRENTEAGSLLVFPSYFKRERPPLDEHPAPFVTYRFTGVLDEIYATLIVRLHHTAAFDRDQLWRFAADFKTPEGRRLGLKMTKVGNASGEIGGLLRYRNSGRYESRFRALRPRAHRLQRSSDGADSALRLPRMQYAGRGAQLCPKAS